LPPARSAARSGASKGFVCASIAIAILAQSPLARAVDVGAPAPEIGVRDTNGAFISLAELQGNVAVVAFFDSSVESTDDLLAGLERIHARHEAEGVAVIAIGTDLDATAFAEYVSRRSVSYRLAHDPEWVAVDRYEPPSLPSVFVLDALGIVRHVQSYADSSAVLGLDRTIGFLVRSRGVPPPPPAWLPAPAPVVSHGPGAGWVVLGALTGLFGGALVLGGVMTLVCVFGEGDASSTCLGGLFFGTVGGALSGAIIGGVSAGLLAMPDEPGPQAGESELRLRVAF
jgi:peroxiredoxin